MHLAFWNNGNPVKCANRGRVMLPDGRQRHGMVNPDPEVDLYEYVEVRASLGEHQQYGAPTYHNDGWKITATFPVVDQTNEQIKADLKRKIKAKRNQVMRSPIEWTDSGSNTYVVETHSSDPAIDVQAMLVGASHSMDKDPTITSQIWRMKDNTLVVLPEADFNAMALRVRKHINDCFAHQKQLEIDLDAAPDPKTVPIDQGWPATWTEPPL